MIATILKTAECRVWWADPWQQTVETLTSVLSEPELDRAARFHREQDRRRFLTGSWLLRTVAATQLGTSPEDVQIERRCPDCPKPHGKPYVRTGGVPLHVSVSHSGNRVVVGVTTAGPLGVDVEEVPAAPVDELAECALSPSELELLDAVPAYDRHAAFARVWVRKEAVLKATGHGLRIPPDEVLVSGPDEAPALLGWPLDVPPESVRLRTLDPGPGYVGAVAVVSGAQVITLSESHAPDLVEVSHAYTLPAAA
ncbi:4'-phosphopantetheinyl transferase superfamily protein [Microbispora corallina]|uniref:4'-phosphopantetheinyl transferase n=1 Tax=Microbispora corallina TaxID=83302 RepID=A0ABQ4FYX9_9ACTN|nr:4'-phosphopantetheinyl transferase superfamily protein [Microbispora corallina]GIH40033.1 4'-phosphopantetheinyl transferase [Microbispora corallina]